jgi:hypothetical protein
MGVNILNACCCIKDRKVDDLNLRSGVKIVGLGDLGLKCCVKKILSPLQTGGGFDGWDGGGRISGQVPIAWGWEWAYSLNETHCSHERKFSLCLSYNYSKNWKP